MRRVVSRLLDLRTLPIDHLLVYLALILQCFWHFSLVLASNLLLLDVFQPREQLVEVHGVRQVEESQIRHGRHLGDEALPQLVWLLFDIFLVVLQTYQVGLLDDVLFVSRNLLYHYLLRVEFVVVSREGLHCELIIRIMDLVLAQEIPSVAFPGRLSVLSRDEQLVLSDCNVDIVIQALLTELLVDLEEPAHLGLRCGRIVGDVVQFVVVDHGYDIAHEGRLFLRNLPD